jgi:folate-dependent phosphoribosylglycinamide formyltransferase PurN
MNRKVFLVVDPDFGEKIFSIKGNVPVWLIDSESNLAVTEKARNKGLNLTTFKSKDRESREMTCERIAQSLDDHFNKYSQTLGYRELEIVGAMLGEMYLKSFILLGFNKFFLTEAGFLAEK